MSINELTDEQLKKELERRAEEKKQAESNLWHTGFLRSHVTEERYTYYKKAEGGVFTIFDSAVIFDKNFSMDSWKQYEPCTEAEYLAALEKTVSLFK
jgi:hypothetical protein